MDERINMQLHEAITALTPLLGKDNKALVALRDWADAMTALEGFDLDLSNAYGTDHTDAELHLAACERNLIRMFDR